MNFHIAAAPHSQAAILRARRQDALFDAFGIGGAVIICLAVISTLATAESWMVSVALVGLVLVFLFMCWTSNNCGELPDDKCGEMLSLCEKTPEGRHYRAAVLEQGRKFVMAEFQMMTDWVEQIPHRTNCKRLYGIAVDDEADTSGSPAAAAPAKGTRPSNEWEEF